MGFLGDEGGGVATASRSVARLAREARRLLNGPADRRAVEGVLRQIDEMAEVHRFNPGAPIVSWLDNLRRQVEGRL